MDLGNETVIFEVFLVGVAVVTYAAFLWWLFGINRRRQDERRASMRKMLTKGLETGAISSLDDVVNLYKGAMRLSSDDLTYRSGVSSYLRDYLVELVSGRSGTEDSADAIQQSKGLVTKWLAENDQSAPFADVPDVERHLIEDIASFLASSDRDGVLRKLDQLASSVTIREQDYQRIHQSNRWSVPLAAFGLFLTIVFGVIAIIK